MRKVEWWVAVAIVAAVIAVAAFHGLRRDDRRVTAFVTIDSAFIEAQPRGPANRQARRFPSDLLIEAAGATFRISPEEGYLWSEAMRTEDGSRAFAVNNKITNCVARRDGRGYRRSWFRQSIECFRVSRHSSGCERSVALDLADVIEQFGAGSKITALKSVSADGSRLLVELSVANKWKACVYDTRTRTFSEVKP